LPLTHGAEHFLRSCQFFSYSTTSQNCTEPEGLLPCSQERSTGPYPDPDQSNPYHPISLLLLLTANGFSPGGRGTTIRQQINNTKTHYYNKTTDNTNTFSNTARKIQKEKIKNTLQIQLTNTVNTNNHKKYKEQF
jgi:hypothetical protein